MILQTFESQPIQYTTSCEARYGGDYSSIIYNEHLCELPRRWAEGEFNFQSGSLLTMKRQTVNGDFVIWVLGVVSTTYWPSYKYVGYELNGVTGEFIRPLNPYNGSAVSAFGPFKMDRSGTVWGVFDSWSTAETLYQFRVEDDHFEANGAGYDLDHFEGGLSNVFGPDLGTGVVLTVNSTTPAGHVTVLSLATGGVLRHIPVAGTPFNVSWENGNRAYVICTNGNLCLVDIVTGELISLLHLPLPANVSAGVFQMTYDWALKRILTCPVTPDTAEGLATIKVKGYKPVPVATRLTKPVQLERLRVGQEARFAARVTGDIGEGVGGTVLRASVDANAILQNGAAATDPSGYGIFRLAGESAGFVNLTLEGEV